MLVVPPRSADCRPSVAPISHHLLRPLLLRLGEEVSLRLGGGGASSFPSELAASSSSSSSVMNQALLQLTQRLLLARSQSQLQVESKNEEEEGKEKRSDESPISLDLTFHLLREVLEMARAEQIAQQADSNRKIMDDFGK
ncbi:hypothetical protein Q5P01_023029 [Channa striata]|uniref:Corticotropin-releasing factor domain-containing protein n=1 Tax=Channa striata TaxID=64152 RepID=A0AA88LS60_CHASR|nr:hypothetical protein Q5P01_023029 [Channa striata]